MFDLEKINCLRNRILALSSEGDRSIFLHQVVDIIAETLNIYYVGIYLANDARDFVIIKAGNGEIGKRLLKYGYRINISESGNFWEQAGTAVHLCEIRLSVLEAGKLFAWKVSEEKVFETGLGDDVQLFVGSPILPLSQMELFLPLQVKGKVMGVMELNMSTLSEFSQDEIVALQALANQIALVLS